MDHDIFSCLAIFSIQIYEAGFQPAYLSKSIQLFQRALDVLPSDHPERSMYLTNLAEAILLWDERDDEHPNLPRAIELLREAIGLQKPGDLDHSDSLNSLATVMLKQYERHGRHTDLLEAVAMSRELLNLSPPGHPNRSISLNNLACATFALYQQNDEQSDLSEAIKLFKEDLSLSLNGHHEDTTSVSLNNLAGAIMMRYRRDGKPSDLSEAIELYKEALSLRPPGHPKHSISLHDLALALLGRYKRYGEQADLLKAIELHRKVLNLRPPGHHHRSASLTNLANAILESYTREGRPSDLSEAIKLQEEALSLLPPDHPGYSISLNNFAGPILMRYWRDSDPLDLSKVIELHKEALSRRPPGHADRPDSLENLANSFKFRYVQGGALSDLSEAIELFREALDLRPPGHLNRSSSLSKLASAILTRYERDGESSDLSEVIELQSAVLDLRPPGHPGRLGALTNLANSIVARFRQGNKRQDLSDAIELHKEVLHLLLPGDIDHPTYLSDLAIAILTRYRCDGELSDLSEGIALHRAALNLRPSGHRGRLDSLINLASALHARFEVEGGQSDLSEAIELLREALDLSSSRHRHRSDNLNQIASTYYHKPPEDGPTPEADMTARGQTETPECQPAENPLWSTIASRLAIYLYQASTLSSLAAQHASDVPKEEIIHLLRDATTSNTSPIPDRLRAALHWVQIASDIDPISVLEAYQFASTLLGGALALNRSLQDMHRNLLRDNELRQPVKYLARYAALWVLYTDSKFAVEFLDRGRNLVLGSIGQFRADLSDVQQQDPGLANEFSRISRLLESAVTTGHDISERKSLYEDPTNRFQRISAEWQSVIKKIRSLPSCESFLLPMPYSKLQEGAAGGPVIIVLVGPKQSTVIIVSFRGEPRTIELSEVTEEMLEVLYGDLKDAVATAMRGETRRADKKLAGVLSELWKALVQPIIHELIEVLHIPVHSRIWWYPTSWASFLPLHAAGSYKKGGKNLPELFISSYTPTLHALRKARSRTAASSDAALGPLVVAQAQTPGQGELFCVDEEAEIVRCLAQNTTLLSGDGGTKENVLTELRNHSWIHLACHGHTDPHDPFQSHFALHDGPLSLQDIISKDLPSAEFAYLSACHSAAQDRMFPDEGLTLAGGMQFAGFKSVVGTLWAMADEDAPTLATAFYEGLAKRSEEGKGFDCTKTAESLHDAVMELRKQKVPLFRWVNLVHYGI